MVRLLMRSPIISTLFFLPYVWQIAYQKEVAIVQFFCPLIWDIKIGTHFQGLEQLDCIKTHPHMELILSFIEIETGDPTDF